MDKHGVPPNSTLYPYSFHLRDYRTIPHLDTYNAEGLDQGDYDSMSPGARAAAERDLRKRDRQDALASGRMRPGLLYEESEDEELGPSQPRRRRGAGERASDQNMDFEQVSVPANMLCI